MHNLALILGILAATIATAADAANTHLKDKKKPTEFTQKAKSVADSSINEPPADGVYFTEPKNFKPVKTGVGCYIQNHKNEILWLFRKKEQKWGVPGGNLIDKETHLESIKREIEEETGLKLNLKEANFFGTCYYVNKKFHLTWHMYAYKSAVPLKPVIQEPDVHSKYDWKPIDSDMKDCMPGTEECLNFLRTLKALAE